MLYLPNEDPYQNPNKPRTDDNWRTTRSVLSRDKIIQNETIKRISVEEILVQEMAKRVSAEDKARDANDRRNHAEYDTWQEKHASNILIQDEMNKAHHIMEDVKFMMKESHANQQSRQRGVDLLMFFHNN